MKLNSKVVKTLMASVAVFLCFVIHTGAATAEPALDTVTTETPREALMRFADRILANQLPDGAIVMGDPSGPTYYINPYFSNLAAFGLMRAFETTRVPRFLDGARAWAGWYLDHLNSDGTIYDYNGSPGLWTPTYTYDSTDSYASTFLETARKILLYTPADREPAQRLIQSVPLLLRAQLLTLRSDGLTLAKPGYDFAFTEDNVEVCRGLDAAAEIPGWDRSNSPDPALQATITLSAVESLLFKTGSPSHFVIARAPDGTILDASNLGNWYPDQQAQLMAVAWLPANADRLALFAYMKNRFFGSLPARLTTETHFDKTVWWAMAALNAGDAAATRKLVPRLMAYRPAAASYNVGLNGHACRILADSIEAMGAVE